MNVVLVIFTATRELEVLELAERKPQHLSES